MGQYLYGETGKTIARLVLPNGQVVQAGVIAYALKPVQFGFKASRDLAALQKKMERRWAKLVPHEYVVRDDGFVYHWIAAPRVSFLDDSTFGHDLIMIGRREVGSSVVGPAILQEKNGCILSIHGDRYYFASPSTGKHSLAISETPSERLWVHWNGFLESQPAPSQGDHTLRVISLSDVMLECSCGKWCVSGTMEKTREEAEAMWLVHVDNADHEEEGNE
jgi:hypothetical protein